MPTTVDKTVINYLGDLSRQEELLDFHELLQRKRFIFSGTTSGIKLNLTCTVYLDIRQGQQCNYVDLRKKEFFLLLRLKFLTLNSYSLQAKTNKLG